jgi:hypothetical protein
MSDGHKTDCKNVIQMVLLISMFIWLGFAVIAWEADGTRPSMIALAAAMLMFVVMMACVCCGMITLYHICAIIIIYWQTEEQGHETPTPDMRVHV